MISLGDAQYKSRVFLAPLSGITDLPYRRVVSRLTDCPVISEMVASQAMIRQTQQSLRKIKVLEEHINSSAVQLAGNEPGVMAEAARLVQDMGARVIDINMGCPQRKVVNGYAGSYLMKDERLACSILESVVNAVNVPVTLKTRLGWDEGCLNAPNLAKRAENIGIKMLCIHGRTRCQMFRGQADWRQVRHVKESVSIPVLVNGDIKSIQDVDDSLEQSGADGVMIGRGANGKPWFLQQAHQHLLGQELTPNPSVPVLREIVLEHYEDMLSFYGERIAVPMARKHLAWYTKSLPGSSVFREAVNGERSSQKVLQILKDFFKVAIDIG
ncbi:MAG: tRNA dihydrouridine synthase DusB [Alphaproteobacteria bacterium]|nr:tRNA dihydrouridine synthase DusB [Alphaproteobacteria bacterium]